MKKYIGLVVIIIVIASICIINNMSGVKVEANGVTLYGNLLKASGNYSNTAVLLIAGSGPTDRNGNSDLVQGENNSFKELAYALKKEGIATFRYDKRSSGKSKETFISQDAIFDDFVEDSIKCIRYLKEKGYEKIYVIGHSQGSLVGMLAAQQEEISGYISLAGAARSIDQVLIEQFENQPYVDEVKEILKNLNEGKVVKDVPESLETMFSLENQRFLMTWMKYDPVNELKNINIPMMFINGTSDLQVPVSELDLFKKAKPNQQYVVINNMNHVLKEVTKDGEDNIKSYTDPSYELNKELVEVIVDFIK